MDEITFKDCLRIFWEEANALGWRRVAVFNNTTEDDIVTAFAFVTQPAFAREIGDEFELAVACLAIEFWLQGTDAEEAALSAYKTMKARQQALKD